MSGISSKAAGELQNKEKTFQGQRFDDDLGLNWVQFKWRNHDPQIGRFIEIDPLANDYVYNSTYAFSENRVTDGVELEGLERVDIDDQRRVERWGRGEITEDQYRAETRAGAVGGILGGFIVASCYYPAASSLFMASYMSGVPLNGAPQMMAETLTSEVVTEGAATSTAAGVSLADKAQVLTAGGEIGMMDGAATLAVDAKTSFFNIKLNTSTETGIITGEVNINNNAIQFGNIEIINAKGGLGSIGQQGSIGFDAFSRVTKEVTDLTKAGGFDKATVEFSRLRPPGSKLPDTETRTITLFDNTKQ